MADGSTICLVGAGNMGGAMLLGWLNHGVDPKRVSIVDPSPPPHILKKLTKAGVTHHEAPPHDYLPDILFIAVKPQLMGAVLPGLAPMMSSENVAISVAAGTTMATLSAHLGDVRLVRAMPNTPAQIGQGMTVCVANDEVTDTQKSEISDLLGSIGDVDWVDHEQLIDAVTAVSGSGPAYVFYLGEVLIEAGEKVGLSRALAAKLAKQTIAGAGALMRGSDLEPSTLRENVTSPNGTTAAALEVLMADDGLAPVVEKAVSAAAERSRELAKD
ncbi:MAG: pyrroline-5-carboxylate reductase [Pseudomonadota bacterium]